jgi:hypothetical protein
MDLGLSMIKAGNESGGKKVLEDYMNEMYRIFKSPDANDVYSSKALILSTGKLIQNRLDELNISSENIRRIVEQVEKEK